MESMPDIAALLRIAQSPAGQKLLALLQNSNADLSQIATAAASGNLDGAKQALAGILSGNEALELLKQLEKQL